MTLNLVDRIREMRSRFAERTVALDFQVLRVRVVTVEGPTGSGESEDRDADTAVIPCWSPIFTTRGAQNGVRNVDMTPQEVGRAKFHFRHDADIDLGDELYWKKDPATGEWIPSPDHTDHLYKVTIDQREEQSAGRVYPGIIMHGHFTQKSDTPSRHSPI